MNDQVLTAEQILNAAEDVLRRFGPAKANVVDVARALGVSHGSVYRHFASKAALRQAVVERWLNRVSQPLESIVEEEGSAAGRLNRWFERLRAVKREKTQADAAMFAAYHALASDVEASVAAHVEHLVAQLSRIIADGMERGEFAKGDPVAAARTTFDATTRFHHPLHAGEWGTAANDAAYKRVLLLIQRGLQA